MDMESKSTPPSAKRRKLDYTEEITVLVGAKEKRFIIHKSIITARSVFFRATVDGTFKEAKDRIVRLPETNPDLFAIYMQWIYTGEIALRDDKSMPENEARHTHKMLLAKLYVLADNLDDKALRNAAVDEFRQACNVTGPARSNIAFIWNATSKPAKLRKFILDIFLFEMGRSEESKIGDRLETYRHKLPPSFFVDLAIAVANGPMNRIVLKNPCTVPVCTYHEHDDTLPPCA